MNQIIGHSIRSVFIFSHMRSCDCNRSNIHPQRLVPSNSLLHTLTLHQLSAPNPPSLPANPTHSQFHNSPWRSFTPHLFKPSGYAPSQGAPTKPTAPFRGERSHYAKPFQTDVANPFHLRLSYRRHALTWV